MEFDVPEECLAAVIEDRSQVVRTARAVQDARVADKVGRAGARLDGRSGRPAPPSAQSLLVESYPFPCIQGQKKRGCQLRSITLPIGEAGSLGDHAQQCHRATAGFIHARLPFAHRLLTNAKVLREPILSHAHVPSESSYS